MSGILEILIILLILLGLFMLPRVIHPPGKHPRQQPRAISGRMRLAILASLIWLGLNAAYFQPWHGNRQLFAYVGAGAVALAWGIFWVVRGFRNRTGR